MAIRAFLCWVLAGAVVTESTSLFPAALGVLVASKAYGVTRAAAVPRLLPRTSRWSRPTAGCRCRASSASRSPRRSPGWPSLAGPEWVLRYAFLLFVARDGRGDPAAGAGRLQPGRGATWCCAAPRSRGRPAGRRTRIPPAVAYALRANCGPRWLSGFLIMFMAFLLRENPIGGLEPAGAVRARGRRRRRRQRPRRGRRVDAQADQPGGHRLGGAGRRRRRRRRSRRSSTASSRSRCSGWSPGSVRRWRSSPSTRRSSATSRTGCRPARSPAATPRCSWPG